MNAELFSDPKEKQRFRELILAMIEGRISFLDGADEVVALMHKCEKIPFSDPDFRVFSVIQSETDNLPRSNQRDLWSKEALARIEPELDRAEIWAKEIALSACWNLYRKIGSN